MARYTAVYDACVLYPAPLRDLLIRLARTGLFRARWTNRIHEEWMRNLVERDARDRAKLERTRELMNAAVPDCLITGYESLIETLQLPDQDDRHVLAAAIAGRADVIVTTNLVDFPNEVLAPYGIVAQHPDDFIICQMDLSEEVVYAAVKAQRAALKNPPYTVKQLLDAFLRNQLPQTVERLRKAAALL